MAPISLKIVLDEGAVVRTLMFDTSTSILQAHRIVREKILTLDPGKEYAFFLTSPEDSCSGLWLTENRPLDHFMLKDGDSLFYLPKIRNLKVRMLDGTVKTLQVDESQKIEELMAVICGKIGITNYEEYGLCRQEEEVVEESKPSTGTLTLNRKTVQREKDAVLQQMSKILKTDDNVEWLDQRRTLRELLVDPRETLLFQRRLFYSDRNVDSRDPVQLNLLYVQIRDAILDGRQVITEDKAVEFAGIQCQIQYGDFQEKKHKPGFIENLKEFLPQQYASSWGIEKKINRIHQKLLNTSHLDAKHLYTKTARELPTYGVTFFLVKEQQKGKRKLVPRLLGINSESILRLDEGTKEILQVWPLTQVKSYTAGNESFTLNFGDYSAKAYVVKTNEAMRIKDILEGYIDIIRKKLATNFNVLHMEGEGICEDMVESSKGATIQNIVPSKIMEQTLVGPSQIISTNQGEQAQHGTSIVTVQQVITTMRGNNSQQPAKGEISMLSYTPQEFAKRLNHLNSECVKTVHLLSNPTKENIQQVRRIIEDMEDGLPFIIKGTKEVAVGLHGDGSDKLLEELDELCHYINMLAVNTKESDLSDPDSLMATQDAATKVAELSTMMCFSLDPKLRRRSHLLMRSRKSFIQDEKIEASLRRASFLNAADSAYQAVEQAQIELSQNYDGASPNEEELKQLKIEQADRMGKLNAAIALLLNAHADPKNIDYEMAVNSMKTVKELMPEFIRDAKPLTANDDGNSGKVFRQLINHLLHRTGLICGLTGSHDLTTMQEEAKAYADAASKLIFKFNKSQKNTTGKATPDDGTVDEINALCNVAEEKATKLLETTYDLIALEDNDPRVNDLKAAAVKCYDALQSLNTCAKLTSSSIHEPHCQSALTAAIENLVSSTHNLALCSRPLVEKPNRHSNAKQLAYDSFDLAKALDKLKDAYSNLYDKKVEKMDVEENNTSETNNNRLKFIKTTGAAANAIIEADKELEEMMKSPITTTKSHEQNPEVELLLAKRLCRLNAAVASLLQATSDKDNPDYDAAQMAASTIHELTPNIMKDTNAIKGTVNEKSWNEIMRYLKDMLEATRGICQNAEENNVQEMNDAATRFTNSSKKLVYVFNPRKNPKKEKEIIDLSKVALQDASLMLSNVYLLAEKIGGEHGEKLDDAGVNVVDAAHKLLRTAEITAPSISDEHCHATLLSSIDSLSNHLKKLENIWLPLQASKNKELVDQLENDLKVVENGLDKLRKACQEETGNDSINISDKNGDLIQEEGKKIKFIVTKSAIKKALTEANKQLEAMIAAPLVKGLKDESNNKLPEYQSRISEKLAQLNAAIATLLQARSDEDNLPYENIEMAMNDISQITPDIIKDAEYLRENDGNKSWKDIEDDLKTMLHAIQEICSESQDGNVKEINEAASKFANSSGKLNYVFNPRRNPKKQDQITDLSRSAVEQTSELLCQINKLAESIGGDAGSELDDAGVKVVDVAQQLIKTTEITAPTIADTRCRSVLLSAIFRLSDILRDLEKTWIPLTKTPEHCEIGNHLDHQLKLIQESLKSLRDACKEDAGNNDLVRVETKEQQKVKKLEFVAKKTAASNILANADKQLDEIINTPTSKKLKGDGTRNQEIQRHISEKLALLNAAISTLLQATSGQDNPDYENAAMAINTISNITPDIIKDTEHLYGNIDDKSLKEITENLKDLLDATRGIICSNSQQNDVKEMNEAASKFANSSGKLTYIFNPHKNPKKKEQISDLSRSAVEQTSQMLSHIHKLASSVGSEEGKELDDRGIKVVDVAQQLLKSAEITGPTIEDQTCKETLLSAISRLSDQIRELEKTWKPLVKTVEHRMTEDQLNKEMKLVEIALINLKDACQDTASDKTHNDNTAEHEQREKKRIKFIATKSAANKALVNAGKQLNEIMNSPAIKNVKGDNNKNAEIQQQISEKLAHLNAAIATLLQASTDLDNVDYVSAESAVNSISQLTPSIIKDTAHLHGNIEDKLWIEIADNLKALLDTTQGICSTSQGDVKEIHEKASKFANSSGRLTYVLNPSKNPKREEQISDFSKSVIGQTSQLLSHIQHLAESVGKDDGVKLDDKGIKVVDIAQQLLKTAEVTAPTIADRHCQNALLSAIGRLSDSLRDLENTWHPLTESPEHRHTKEQLNHDMKLIQTSLDNLRDACKADVGISNAVSTRIIDEEQQEKKRLKFISTKSKANNLLKNVDKQLDKIMNTPVSKKSKGDSSKHPEFQHQISKKLAQLNAAIATLLQANSDQHNRDYDGAEIAINNISKITPDIIKDTENLHENMDDKSRKELIDNLKVMLHAIQGICSNSEDDLKEINEAASKFSYSSGKLTYVFNPRKNRKKERQISGLSRSVTEQTSQMLSHVYQLANSVGSEDGNKLDDVGVKVADVTQQLLKTAEITAPTINNTSCRTALLSAIARLYDHLQDLEKTWKPLIKSPENRQAGDQLDHDVKLIRIALDDLKDACQDGAGIKIPKDPESQKLLFIATALSAKKAMAAAEKDFKGSNTSVTTIDKAEVPAMKRSLAHRLARLNSTLASLVLATADDENPDYNSATRSIYTITSLTPDIIKDVKSIKGVVDQNCINVIDDNLSDIVVTTRDICKHVEDNNPKELKEAAFRCAKSVGRLSYVFGPPLNSRKESQIIDLSRSAAESTSLMLSEVYQLADKIRGEKGKLLNTTGAQVINASQMLQKTAEILAPTIKDSYCQETLISSADELSNLSDELKSIWKPLVQTPQHRQFGDQLDQHLKHVHTILDELREACQDTDDNNIETDTSRDHQINVQNAKDKIKEAEMLFLEDTIAKAANDSLHKETGKTVLEQRAQLSHKIASLNEAMAYLLQAMLDFENIDVEKIEQNIDIISNITPEIAKETIALHRNVDDKSRDILFEEAKALCTATQAVCDGVDKRNMEDLNNAATQYAQSSRNLRYIISLRSYPNKEMKIINMSRSACERTSLMLSRVSRLAQSTDRQKGVELDVSGAKVANAAQVFLNNAQITASSINEPNCQLALSSTADMLCKHAQGLKEIWMSLAQRPEHKEIGDQLHRDLRLLINELDNLKKACQDNTEEVAKEMQTQKCFNSEPKQPSVENIDYLLQNIQNNAKDGKTPEHNKVTERLTIEDNPLRQLASKILHSVLTKINTKDISTTEQRELDMFSKELEAAIKSFDITNAKCLKEPLDSKKRQDLENAIMNLQQICLLSRRKNEDQNNVVDLKDYISDLTASVDALANTADEVKTEEANAAVITDIKSKCEKIRRNASKLLTIEEEEEQLDGNIIDDMLKIINFTKDCDKQLKDMNLDIAKLNDDATTETLKDKLQTFAECCDLLRFATKSSISSATSAALDDSLQNLEQVEKKMEIILKPIENQEPGIQHTLSKSTMEAAQTAFATVVAAGNENALPKALVQYAVQMRGSNSGDQKYDYRLQEHLKKLLALLKTHTVEHSRHVVTWQELKDETAATTEKVLEELKCFAEEVEKSQNKQQKGVLNQVKIIKDSNIKYLLTSHTSTVPGDQKELNDKLYQQIQKLTSITGTIPLSLHKPQSLTRSLHTTAEVAKQLAALARSIKSEDPVQNKRIEEAVQEMNVATYNLLKTSECTSSSSNIVDSRRRLFDANKLLNEALNKLARAASPADKMKNECCEMNRNLQLQQTFLQANTPTCGLSYPDCIDALNNQNDVLKKLQSEEPILRSEMSTSLRYVTSSVCNSAEFAAQSAYLLSVSDADQTISRQGVIDLARLYKITEATEDVCLQMICAGPGEQASSLKGSLANQVQQLQEAVDEAADKVKDDHEHPLVANSKEMKFALQSLHNGLQSPVVKVEDFTLKIMKHIDCIRKINAILQTVPQPKVDNDPKKTSMSNEVIDNTKSLLTSTSMMVKKASTCREELITWRTLGSSDVIKAFEALVACIKEKGAQAGLIESLKSQEEIAAPKSFVQKQIDLANVWLRTPVSTEQKKSAGVAAAEHVLNLAELMSEDLSGADREEMKGVLLETKQLLNDCTVKYNSEKASLLLERLKELRKMLERGVVTRVVEDFLVEPLDNLDTLVTTENDARKRKFLLEKKIAELLSQLGRVKKTARFVADTGHAQRHELTHTTDQVELLAPVLVKAAQKRIDSPNDKGTLSHYEELLQQYAQSLLRVRELCDQAVDPIDFAQAAGETMHRIKEESAVSNDPHKNLNTSKVILRLGNRVVKAGMKSSLVKNDPELKETLAKIEYTVSTKYNDVKRSDWREVMAEIMKKTGEVESALGGENIFLKQAEPDRPIYAAALDLHAAVREWSARDNEIVAVAKRMAVLMAKLSDYMHTENKRELLHTSKCIVSKSKEVTALAKKLALECTDMRIRTNLLQVCEQIPTISGQLKMLTTIKGSSFGQGSKEDQEAMTMLVGNAQNLMTSIQDVVKAAASASVKIMSQRGPRMKWVRRNYY